MPSKKRGLLVMASVLMRGLTALVSSSQPRMKYLSQTESIEVDQELFKYFSLDSLMELAGLSVAAAVRDAYSPKRIVCVCGPGNNGGDGLVAARHLKFFGFTPLIVYPKKTEKPVFLRLLSQMDQMQIEVLEKMPRDDQYDLILDCVFGFSFSGEAPRFPFDKIIHQMSTAKKPIIAVDIPSGWHVEEGPRSQDAVMPSVLISLTAPKHCAIHFNGPHYLGGRFVPDAIQAKFGFRQPHFSGANQFLRLDTLSVHDEATPFLSPQESRGSLGGDTTTSDDDDRTDIQIEVTALNEDQSDDHDSPR